MKKSELINYVPKNCIPADISADYKAFVVTAREWEYYHCINVYKADTGILLYTTFLDRHHGDWVTWDVGNRKWLTCMVCNYPDAYGLASPYSWYSVKCRYLDSETKSLWAEEFPGDGDLLQRILRWQRNMRGNVAEARYRKGQEQIESLFATCKPLPKDIEKWIANVPMRRYRFMYYKKLDKTHYTGYCTHCHLNVFGECKPGKLRDVRGRCPHCHSAVTFTPIGNSASKSFLECFYILDRGSEDSLILSQYRVCWKFHRGDPRDYRNEPYHSVALNGRCIINRYGQRTYFFREPISVAGNIRIGWSESGGYFREGWVYQKSLSKNLTGRWERCAAKYTTQDTLYHTVEKIFTEWFKHPVLESLAKAGYHRILRDYIGDYECSRFVNTRATEMQKVLYVTRSSARALREVDGNYKVLRFCQMMEQKGLFPTAEELRMVSLFCDNFRFETVCEKADMRKWLPWAVKICRKEKLNPKDFPSDYNDYLRDLDFLKLTGKEYLFPKNFSEMHFNLADEVAEIKDKGFNEGILKAAKKFAKIFEFQQGEYVAMLPQRAKDLRAEGRALHHCVGGFADRVSKQKCIIIFVRNVKAPEKSLATAEFSPEGICLQFRAFGNKCPDKNAMDWFQNYEKHIKQKLEEQKHERIKRKNRRRDRSRDQSDQTADGTAGAVRLGGDRQASDGGQGVGAPRPVGAMAG